MERLNRDFHKSKAYTEKVLQFGEGNFLRGFADWQIDVMNKKAGWDAGVVVVQPLPQGMAGMLNEQDGLYTVYLEGIKHGEALKEHTVVECVTRVMNPYESYNEYEALVRQPELRFIISNTTEAGITFAPEDRLEDAPQSSFPGKLTAFLYRRYQYFKGDPGKGFIIIPCELIDRNGEELKKIVLQYTKLWNLESGFSAWLEEANTFCCSLVDRIVPGYPQDRMEEITTELGYEDRLVVVGEQFHLWVIEGPQFVKDELPVEQAGLNVLVVDDMTPYRTRKVRILNGAHTALTPVAYLYGLETVKEAVEHDTVGAFVDALIREEIIPTLDLPEAELRSFAAAVMERFKNPFVRHYVMSIALNSVSKFKTRDLPTLLRYVDKQGKLPEKMVFSLAALIAFYKGKRGEQTIELADDPDVLDWFREHWAACDGAEAGVRRLTEQVLGNEAFWGKDLNDVSGLTDLTAGFVAQIETQGMKETLNRLVSDSVRAS
ncbi:tagaturonate reductase [Paenibacillus enshidis]|uniref:Altronate oxidoreductase n=1 Tax=Paenibacillus enshidis TaxID=1458439 RepID=A0ABV5AMB2_9BACL